MIICSLLRHPRFMPLLDQVFRYCMASVLLVVKAARDQDEIDDIEVKKKLLTHEELMVCKPMPMEHRPMIPWVWIAAAIDEAFAAGHIAPTKHNMVILQIVSARNGIQTMHTYLKTQLPFAYVHLLTLLVSLNTQVVSIKCGAVIARDLRVENYVGIA